MRLELHSCPKTIDESTLYGFSWMENVLAIPSPLVTVTCYKSNGMANATMQSWCTFVGEEGYHVILGSVNKREHLYTALQERGCCVVNLPGRSILGACMATIQNNGFDQDELAVVGLKSAPARLVDAPMLADSLVSLECRVHWERDMVDGGNHAVVCLKVVNVWMDEGILDENARGRYGRDGYLYNIHSPRNPQTGKEEETIVGVLDKLAPIYEI